MITKLLFFCLVIVVAVVFVRLKHANLPYTIKNNLTAFSCESIGKHDLTDDFVTERISHSQLNKAYDSWKQKAEQASCNNIDKIIID